MSTTLVEARDLRIDIDGRPVVANATFTIAGPSAVLTGDGYAVLAALAQDARIVAGSLTVMGSDVATGAHFAWTGLAPLDPPLEGTFSAHEYVGWGARLAGVRSADADARAARTLDRLGLAALTRSPIAKLSLVERRAVVLARAAAAEPRLLVAAAPLSRLATREAAFLADVHARATEGRAWLATAASIAPPSPERALAARATEVLDFVAGTLVRKGPLAAIETDATGFELCILGEVGAFAALLAARGLTLQGGPARYFVDLPVPLSQNDLLAWSIEAKAPIIELALRLKPPAGC